jgi:hypothetical protein
MHLHVDDEYYILRYGLIMLHSHSGNLPLVCNFCCIYMQRTRSGFDDPRECKILSVSYVEIDVSRAARQLFLGRYG